MIHICLENPELLAETQATLRQELQVYGITKITIQTDSSLEEHDKHCVSN